MHFIDCRWNRKGEKNVSDANVWGILLLFAKILAAQISHSLLISDANTYVLVVQMAMKLTNRCQFFLMDSLKALTVTR